MQLAARTVLNLDGGMTVVAGSLLLSLIESEPARGGMALLAQMPVYERSGPAESPFGHVSEKAAGSLVL
jgi:hypothetical protein